MSVDPCPQTFDWVSAAVNRRARENQISLGEKLNTYELQRESNLTHPKTLPPTASPRPSWCQIFSSSFVRKRLATEERL